MTFEEYIAIILGKIILTLVDYDNRVVIQISSACNILQQIHLTAVPAYHEKLIAIILALQTILFQLGSHKNALFYCHF